MKYLYAIAQTPNGALVNVHRLHQVTLEKERVLLTLNHFADASQEIPTWQDQYPMPLETFQLGSYPDCIWDWIVSADGLFPGGQILNEPTQLEDAKKIKHHQIERARDGQIFGGFEFVPFGRFATDARSMDNILGAAQGATVSKMLNQPFNRRWKLAGKTYAEVDADQLIAVGMRLLTFVSAVYQRSWDLKDLLEAAETNEEVDAIQLDGWPIASNSED